MWSISSQMCLRIFHGHTEQVNAVAISSDGSVILSGSADRTIRVHLPSSYLTNSRRCGTR